MSVEAWSDALGFASGIVLVISAFRNDGLSAFIGKLKTQIQAAKEKNPKNSDKWAGPVVESLEQDLATWGTSDRVLLRLGVALLCLSYGVKAVPTLWKIFVS